MKKVFVTDKWFPKFDELERRVKALDGEVVYASAGDKDTFIREGSDAVCVFNTSAKVPSEYIKTLKNCRTIVRTGIGVDTIDLDIAGEMGICVSNIPDYCQSEVADHAVALALAVMRKIPQMNGQTHAGMWENAELGYIPRMSELTLGLLGFGGIAKKVAQRFSGFGVSIVAYDPYLSNAVFEAFGVKRAETPEDIYQIADVISLHMPLTNETQHMIHNDAIAMMKDNVYIINTARGKLVDQAALCAGLASGKIAGAGLDVAENEPLSADDPILRFDQVIVTPHTGYYSVASMPDLCEKAMDEVERALRGEPNRIVANKKALKR